MTALLMIIYVSFVSLGLPNSLLGSAWPVMQADFSASMEIAGYLSMLVFGCTVVSALLSSRMIARFGPAKTTIVSIFLMGFGLFGFSVSSRLWMLYLFCVPMGLGSGCVDAALNNFVALHYQPRHMSWLHCFWGVGATLGPMILSMQMRLGGTWRSGYRFVAFIITALVAVLVATSFLWKRAGEAHAQPAAGRALSTREVFSLSYVKPVLVTFIFACAMENTASLWSASYLIGAKQYSAEDAALLLSYHFAAITVSRLLAGILAAKMSDENLVRLGLLLTAASCVLLLLPLPSFYSVVAITLMGLGLGPVFPNLLHTTPGRFGREASQSVLGVEMAFAYAGSTFVPPLFGLLARRLSIDLFPVFLLTCAAAMIVLSEIVRKRLCARSAAGNV